MVKYNKIVIINFRSREVSYLPIYELLIAGALHEAGIAKDIRIFTLFSEENVLKYANQWRDSDLFILWEYFSTKSPSYVHAYIQYAPVLKEKFGKTVCFGGFWATSYGGYFKEFHIFDKIFIGYSIDRLVEVLHDSEKLESEGKFIDITGDSNFDKYRLDPSFLATPGKYFDHNNKALRGYITAFSCPRNCKFCFANSARNSGSGFCARNVDKVKNDIDILEDFFGFEQIVIKDLNFFFNTERAFQILDYLEKKGKKVKVNLDITLYDINETFLKNLKKYNIVDDLYFGLESFDPESRKKIGKPFTAEQLDKAFQLVEQYHFNLVGNIIVGLPWQTFASIKNEIRSALYYIDKYKHVYIMINAYKPEYASDIQRDYFPHLHEKINFKDLVDIYLNKVFKYQKLVYGKQFNEVNIEFLFNIMHLINKCKRFENRLRGFKKKVFFNFRRVLVKIALRTFSPGPVTRIMLSGNRVQFLIKSVFPLFL